MNLPFGIPAYKVTISRRREASTEATARYERRIAEYRDILESYKKCIQEYTHKLDSYDRHSMESQFSIVQTALDLTYIKEQGENTIKMLETMKASANNSIPDLDSITLALSDSNSKLEALDRSIGSLVKSFGALDSNVEGLDKNVVNRISELLLELQKQTVYQNKLLNTELLNGIDKVNKNVKNNRVLLWFILIFNIFGLSAIAFIVLYYLEIIPFAF